MTKVGMWWLSGYAMWNPDVATSQQEPILRFLVYRKPLGEIPSRFPALFSHPPVCSLEGKCGAPFCSDLYQMGPCANRALGCTASLWAAASWEIPCWDSSLEGKTSLWRLLPTADIHSADTGWKCHVLVYALMGSGGYALVFSVLILLNSSHVVLFRG